MILLDNYYKILYTQNIKYVFDRTGGNIKMTARNLIFEKNSQGMNVAVFDSFNQSGMQTRVKRLITQQEHDGIIGDIGKDEREDAFCHSIR
jgi:hypothetical protein